ncbi:DUF2243 domain-containing protein [Nocardioides sp.]|uniref:DUF2243 domain-containing protein n=1 Tax=Nocardioides sp. TaxID=35761 RepID=UPI0039C90920
MARPSDGSVPSPSRPPSQAVGVLFGAGLGGFVDGIVLHQILQRRKVSRARRTAPRAASSR